MVRVRLCTQIDADLHTLLKKEAKKRGCKIADIVNKAVRKHLDEG